MKKNKRIFLITFITIIMIFSLINFANINMSYASNKLSKPENLKWNETKPGVLTFSKVQNADEYWAVISKDGQEIGMGGDENNEVSIQGLMEQYGVGTYTVQLSARRLDGSFQSSEKVTTTYTAKQLSKPENLKWSDSKPGILTFSKVQYADEYWAVISKDGQEIGMGGDENNEVSIQGLMEQHGAGTYTVQLSARRLDNLLPASEKVTTTYIVKDTNTNDTEDNKGQTTKPSTNTKPSTTTKPTDTKTETSKEDISNKNEETNNIKQESNINNLENNYNEIVDSNIANQEINNINENKSNISITNLVLIIIAIIGIILVFVIEVKVKKKK